MEASVQPRRWRGSDHRLLPRAPRPLEEPARLVDVRTTRAVIFDRDGTLIEDVHYLNDATKVRLFPEVGPALAMLKDHFRIFVATNQPGVARRRVSSINLLAIHAELNRQLGMWGVQVEAFYVCEHDPVSPHGSIRCTCRKPLPGLLFAAARDWNLTLEASYMVGDSLSDVEAAIAAHCQPILVARP